jgi:hypothetical protein
LVCFSPRNNYIQEVHQASIPLYGTEKQTLLVASTLDKWLYLPLKLADKKRANSPFDNMVFVPASSGRGDKAEIR